MEDEIIKNCRVAVVFLLISAFSICFFPSNLLYIYKYWLILHYKY